jgi:hypothetical protein
MIFLLALTGCQQQESSQATAVPPTTIATSIPATSSPTATTMPSPTAEATATTGSTAVSQPTIAPQPIRIHFAPGAIASTQTGTVQPLVAQEYLLYALGGQTMHVSLTSPNGNVNFALQGVSDGQPYKRVENEDRFWDGNLPQSQDYLIRIITADAAENYTLNVMIDPLPTEPQRIEFAPGAVSASVSGTIEPNTYDQYVLSAQAGQTMHVFLAATNGQANFDLVGKSDGVPYKRAIVGPPSWEGFLPMTQDYLINVSAPADTGDSYTLSITIDPANPEPTPERIQFPAGGISTTINGTFAAGGDGRSFILNAGAGQNMTIQVSSTAPGAITIFLKDETGRILIANTDENPISINLDHTADYTIFLSSPGAAPAINYSMTVTIP